MKQRLSYQGSFDDAGNGLGSDNVRLDRLGAVLSLLLALAERETLSVLSQKRCPVRDRPDVLPNNNEGTTLFVLQHRS